jgi:redox-sensitive bicupin YhaK (pirin superfamily)
VVAHGPFVINTRDDIATAIRDYHAGAFDGTGPLPNVGA